WRWRNGSSCFSTAPNACPRGCRCAEATHLYWEPLVGVLIETSAGWVLFDTGMSRRNH
ncbi:MAG: hypothetical protein AVDCRST_MAG48-3518, partial [uncultured Friedmanniella sp.]